VVSHDTDLFYVTLLLSQDVLSDVYFKGQGGREGRWEIKVQSLKAHPPNFQWNEGMKRNERSSVP
jgi:hypothetical protein